jgi:integrase
MTRGTGRRNQDKGAFGTVSKLPSGRWRALYYGPEGKAGRRYSAPKTFTTKGEARKWLSTVQADIIRHAWLPPADQRPAAPPLTLAAYAATWLAHRDLKDRTRAHYSDLLEHHILPVLGRLPLASITADDVRAWHAKTAVGRPTLRAHCYGLLRTVLGTAASDGKIAANPCAIRGAGTTKRAITIRPVSLAQLEALTAAMPEAYRLMIPLACWTALRFGELTELRRSDVDCSDEVIRVRRAVVRAGGRFVVTTPKSEAGRRDVTIPPHLLPAIEAHLAEHVGPQPDALLFPAAHGGHLAPSTLYRRFYTARKVAGHSDLRFHDLRHSGAVLAALSGATLAELMGRLGHATPAAALRYQHIAGGRDREIAQMLSKLADNGSGASWHGAET